MRLAALVARMAHVLAMWRYERSGYRSQTWLYVAMAVMLIEIELLKELTRRDSVATRPRSATPKG